MAAAWAGTVAVGRVRPEKNLVSNDERAEIFYGSHKQEVMEVVDGESGNGESRKRKSVLEGADEETDGVGGVNYYRSRRSLLSGGNVPTRRSKRTFLQSSTVHLKPVTWFRASRVNVTHEPSPKNWSRPGVCVRRMSPRRR